MRLLAALLLIVTIGCDEQSDQASATGSSTVQKGTGAGSNSTKTGSPGFVKKSSESTQTDSTSVSSQELTQQPPVEKTDPPEEPPMPKPEKDPPIPEKAKPLNAAKTLYFENIDGVRKVHVLAEVCLREGMLEVLLCKNQTKEHESILRTAVDAREIHFALVAMGAKPGSVVKFVPEFVAPKGPKMKISLTYHINGKLSTVAAQEWILNKKTEKALEHPWVFAGSRFLKDPDRPNDPPFYTANNGELIVLSNFPDAMLDLPIRSPKEEADLLYDIRTKLVPPLLTKVLVTFELAKEEK
ncbi:MAG: YdjY domain-containing protein [Zavarzinella sp.]